MEVSAVPKITTERNRVCSLVDTVTIAGITEINVITETAIEK